MENILLDFKPIIENRNLVSKEVYDIISSWSEIEPSNNLLVAEINPDFCGGIELCEKYNINPKYGANCLIVDAMRNQIHTYAALVVPVGFRYNMSSTVRKELKARMVSAAPLDFVLEKTKMEYGSITPIGLPEDWLLFIDPKVLDNEKIIIGSGYKKSKLMIPSRVLLNIPNAKILDGLAKEI